MIGFGIPINEFSFGNTLISAGVTASVGGLVIIAVSVAVGQLRRIAGMLADPAQTAAHARLALPADDDEHAAAQRKGPGIGAVLSAASAPAPRGGYPQRAKERTMERPASDPFALEPEPAPMMPAGQRADQSFAPSLRNPDEASVAVEDDVSLSPRHPQPAAASAAGPPGPLDRTSDSFDWRVPPAAPGGPPPLRPPSANFDAMWPAENKPTRGPAAAPRTSPGAEPKADAPAREAFPPGQPANTRRAEPEKPRSVAILKSGVVDGMGYTLYVDGSIEAELPQGTLRFASINELRSHLEKNS
jgi:hypothetical protein